MKPKLIALAAIIASFSVHSEPSQKEVDKELDKFGTYVQCAYYASGTLFSRDKTFEKVPISDIEKFQHAALSSFKRWVKISGLSIDISTPDELAINFADYYSVNESVADNQMSKELNAPNNKLFSSEVIYLEKYKSSNCEILLDGIK